MKTLLALAFLFLASAPAHAMTYFSIVGAGTYDMPTYGGSSNGFSSKVGLGGGALLEFRGSPGFGIEFGGLYAPRKFSTGGVTYTVNRVEVPVLLRFHFSNAISLGLGGFYSKALGNFKDEFGGESSYDFNGRSDTDYGAAGSLQIRLPMGGSTHFLIHGRYIYGLKNQAGYQSKSSDAQVLAGFQFGF